MLKINNLINIHLTKIQEKMPDIKIERIYPLAPFQEVVYEHATNEPDTNAYFEQTIWALEGSWILNSYSVFPTVS
ncbi:hypothetical protein AAHB62_09390 [Bacillus cereus]